MQSPVALRPLAPPACLESPEAYTRAVYGTRRQRPRTVVIHASFNAPQADGETVKSFCSVARMSPIGSGNPVCRSCVKLPRLPAAMVIPEGYVLSMALRFGPLPSTCLFRYAFRSCGQPRRFRFPVPFVPYSHASRRRRMFSARLSKLPQCDSRRGMTGSARFLPHSSAKLTAMYTTMGLPHHAGFPPRRLIRPVPLSSPR